MTLWHFHNPFAFVRLPVPLLLAAKGEEIKFKLKIWVSIFISDNCVIVVAAIQNFVLMRSCRGCELS